jgi:pimeloyl-ACP methyl ester carboxylesterase
MNLISRVQGSLCIFLSAFFAVWVSADEGREIRWNRPPGKLVSIGTHRLHLYCTKGEGPTVILDAGLGGFSLDWFKVQGLLSENNIRACSYDRAGYGWSDRGPSPRATDQIVDELSTLLEVAELPAPYVMVGHSFGGFNMIYFAKLYASQTAGLVLVDSSHPEQAERLPSIPNDKTIADLDNFQRVFTGESLPLYPDSIRNLVAAILSSRKTADTERREYVNYPISAAQINYSGRLGDMPLVVVSRGEQEWSDDPLGEAMYLAWMDMQKDLSKLNASGTQIIAEGSGHLIPLEKPELVVDAIQLVIAELNKKAAHHSVCRPDKIPLC